MISNWKAALASLVFAATSFGAGAAFTAGAQARTEWGSAENIAVVRNRLGSLISQLQRDDRDYGGHRAAAVADMEQARAQLTQALDYDRDHPGH